MKPLACSAMRWALLSNIATDVNTKPKVSVWENYDKISLEGLQTDHVTTVIPIKSLLENSNGSGYTVSKTVL